MPRPYHVPSSYVLYRRTPEYETSLVFMVTFSEISLKS